ncbi:MAG: DEAD/DEAH box helicase [Thermoplasmata archaeon]|nr:DEAD/DEAH box helicase [Thermoplasmata archaeon]
MTFANLGLMPQLLQAVAKEGYATPTPIQEQAIPHVLQGKDLIGIAQTGTGKTAAFVLPILQLMSRSPRRVIPNSPRTLVLAPTRELAAQIDESFAAYGSFMKFWHTVVFGGVSQVAQVREISRGVDVLVATPGRLLDLMNQGHINLGHLEFFVLDEVDRMLDMGFIVDVKRIISKLPTHRQSLFFSATMSPRISELAKTLLRNPVRVEVAPQATTVRLVKQKVLFVDEGNKNAILLKLLRHEDLKCVLVFARTKRRANNVAKLLTGAGIQAEAIHGNKSQGQRTRALDNFKSGHARVLVATDIAARGIDIDDISHVINYDLPVGQIEYYVHRIGRTARAGAKGTAYSLCASYERDALREIESLIRMKIEVMPHSFHSDKARDAVGAAARPPPKQHRGQRRSDINRQRRGRFQSR